MPSRCNDWSKPSLVREGSGGVTLGTHNSDHSIDMDNAFRMFQYSGAFSGQNTSIFNNPQALEPSPEVGTYSTMRSGASEHDDFYFPTPVQAPRVQQHDGLYRQATQAGSEVGSSFDGSSTQVSDTMYYTREQVEMVSSATTRLATQGLQQQLAHASAQAQQVKAELAEKDQQLQQQSVAIHHLSAQVEALQIFSKQLQAAKSLKTPQSVPRRMADTSATESSFGSEKAEDGSEAESWKMDFKSTAIVPASAMGNLTPHQKRPFQMTPNPADDVFDGPKSVSPTPGPRVFRQADFEKKELPELLSSCFMKVEAAVRKVPINNISSPGRRSREATQIIRLLQDHIGNNKLAYGMLEDKDERYWAMIALLSHTLVDYIFKDHILGNVQSFEANTFRQIWDEEQATSSYGHPKISDLFYRQSLAEQRAHWARTVVQVPGFWKWVQSFTITMTETIINDFAVVFPQAYHGLLTQELWKAVNEGMRISIRMKQDPTIQEYSFPPTGTPWSSKFHVHRNQELMGQKLDDNKSPYCVRIAAMPIVKTKSFAGDSVAEVIQHKAEVLVGDRQTHLRAARNRRGWKVSPKN